MAPPLLSHGDVCAPEDTTHAKCFLLHNGSGQCLAIVDKSSDNLSPAVDDSGNEIRLQICDEHAPGQRWLFDFQHKRIHSPEHSPDLYLTQLPEALSLEPYRPFALTQWWYFNQRDELFNRENVGYFSAPLSLLTLRFVHTDNDEHHCYLSPFTGNVECPQFAVDHAALQKLERRSWQWTGRWPWQPAQAKLTQDIQLADNKSHRCLAVAQCHTDSINQYDCFGGAKVQVIPCLPSSHQRWRYDLVSKRLFNKQAGEHFCLNWQPTVGLSLEHCSIANTTAQRWYFARGKGHRYLHRGRLRWFANREAQYDFTGALDFAPVVVFQALDNPECGYHPIDGLWQGPCQ